jgi:hypothetical protein
MKKHRSFLFLAMLSLLLSGFTVRPPAVASLEKSIIFRFTTTIQSDISGDIKIEAILSPDLVALLNSVSETDYGEEFCSTLESGLSLFHYTLTTENNGVQCTAVESFENQKELENLMGYKGLGVDIQRLEVKDGRLYYSVRINMSEMESSPYFTVEIYWVLALPGKIGENNADTVNGNTLTWDLSGSPGWTSMTAESSIGGGFLGMDSSTLAIVSVAMMSCCCCVILLLAAGAAVFLALRGKKRPAPEERSPDTIILGS